jgi:hypothetical protein
MNRQILMFAAVVFSTTAANAVTLECNLQHGGRTFFSIFECNGAVEHRVASLKCGERGEMACALMRSFARAKMKRRCLKTCVPQV